MIHDLRIDPTHKEELQCRSDDWHTTERKSDNNRCEDHHEPIGGGSNRAKETCICLGLGGQSDRSSTVLKKVGTFGYRRAPNALTVTR